MTAAEVERLREALARAVKALTDIGREPDVEKVGNIALREAEIARAALSAARPSSRCVRCGEEFGATGHGPGFCRDKGRSLP